MEQDFITYARYKVVRDKYGKITDMIFIFANDRMKSLIGIDPINRYRSEIMPVNDKICKYAQNMIDIGIAKHFSYNDDKFGYIEGIMEPDVEVDIINMYTIDVDQLKDFNNGQILRNQISTILSMYNITLMHWNAKEHYIYRDTILTTDFNEENADLYIGNTIRSSYGLYKIVNDAQKQLIDKEVDKLLNKKVAFLNFTLIVNNSIGETISIRVIVIPEQIEDMYLIGIQY